MTNARRRLTAVLPWLTGTGVFVELLSLRLGLLNCFFADAVHADVQGIDYFSLPRAFLNLASGHSAYDTFAPFDYGPHFTWYLSHPALVLLLGSWLSRMAPMDSYGAFTMLSLALMATCAAVMAQQSNDALVRRLIWFLLLTAFPTYWMLFVGNVQAILVLALGLLFSGVFGLAFNGPRRSLYPAMVFIGLMLSLLTKPAVLLLLPVLLLMKETRRAALAAVALYFGTSVLFESMHTFNPEGIGTGRVLWLAFHPSVVMSTMNIYTNHLQLNADMKDNSIHWLNLIAQSGSRLMHIDVYSMPVFADTLLGTRVPNWIFEASVALTLVLQVLVSRIADRARRLEAALLVLMASSLLFFLAYATVWEYQYTGVLPVAATLLLLHERRAGGKAVLWMSALAAAAWLPSLYVFTEGRALTATVLTLIRSDRVLPVTALFTLLTVAVVRALRVTPNEAQASSVR